MKAPIQLARATRRARAGVLLILVAGALLLACNWDSAFSPAPLVLRFLYYTNNAGRDRIAVMEISNRTDSAYEWRLHSSWEPRNQRTAITELVETNGDLRAVSPYDGDNLFGHDTCQFGTTEFQIGKYFWVEAKHYPKTGGELRREKLARWLWRNGLHRAAPYVRQGRRINGPVLPPDGP